MTTTLILFLSPILPISIICAFVYAGLIRPYKKLSQLKKLNDIAYADATIKDIRGHLKPPNAEIEVTSIKTVTNHIKQRQEYLDNHRNLFCPLRITEDACRVTYSFKSRNDKSITSNIWAIRHYSIGDNVEIVYLKGHENINYIKKDLELYLKENKRNTNFALIILSLITLVIYAAMFFTFQ